MFPNVEVLQMIKSQNQTKNTRIFVKNLTSSEMRTDVSGSFQNRKVDFTQHQDGNQYYQSSTTLQLGQEQVSRGQPQLKRLQIGHVIWDIVYPYSIYKIPLPSILTFCQGIVYSFQMKCFEVLSIIIPFLQIIILRFVGI